MDWLSILLGFLLGIPAGVLGNTIFARLQQPRLTLESDPPHDDTSKNLRILHLRLENSGRQTADCSATATIRSESGDVIARYALRFSENPTPLPNETFAPERFLLRPHNPARLPVAYKLEGWDIARAFTRPVHIFGLANPPEEHAPSIPPGRFTIQVRVDYGTQTPFEQRFTVVNNGTRYTDICFQ